MGIWRDWLLPPLEDIALGGPNLVPFRREAAGAATGRVLEVGIGSGRNLPYYGRRVRHLTGIDPSRALLSMARRRARTAPFRVRLLRASAERLPFAAGAFDHVVLTFSLCTIPDPASALAEIRRVLSPLGALSLAEHGLAPDPKVARWQHRLTPPWRAFAGGCHMNRDMSALLAAAGFSTAGLERGYTDGPPMLSYMTWGLTRPTRS